VPLTAVVLTSQVSSPSFMSTFIPLQLQVEAPRPSVYRNILAYKNNWVYTTSDNVLVPIIQVSRRHEDTKGHENIHILRRVLRAPFLFFNSCDKLILDHQRRALIILILSKHPLHESLYTPNHGGHTVRTTSTPRTFMWGRVSSRQEDIRGTTTQERGQGNNTNQANI